MTESSSQKKLLFTKAEWDEAIPQVARDMTRFLSHRRAPVFEDHHDHGDGWGSGSFLQLGHRIFILTNEHVSTVRRQGRTLASQLLGQEDIWKIIGKHFERTAPLDLALLPVPDSVWAKAHNSTAITVHQIAIAHQPVFGELLAFTGFAGERVQFHFNTLVSESTCSVAREIELPRDPRFDTHFHFGLDYRPDLAEQIIGSTGLPLPPGLSGSTVWNTNFVGAKMAGQPWTPDLAQVTGVVWGWPSDNGCLIATRAEYLRCFLLEAARTLGISLGM